MSRLTFWVDGEPPGQGSKKFVGRAKNGKPLMAEASERVMPYRKKVHQAAMAACLSARWITLNEPVAVRVTVWMQRPASHYRSGRYAALLKPGAPERPTVPPDVDKIARLVLDSLTTSGAIRDDSRVVDLHIVEFYAVHPSPAGVAVTVEGAGLL